MARGINKVILVGNVGADPEMRHLPNGNPVTTLSLATSESWKDKQSGEKQERTEWHRVICFNRLGQIAGDYVRKGSKLYIEGSLRTRKWQDAQNIERYTTEIIASEIQMLDSKSGSNFEDSNYSSNYNAAPSSTPSSSSQFNNSFEEIEDDIPF